MCIFDTYGMIKVEQSIVDKCPKTLYRFTSLPKLLLSMGEEVALKGPAHCERLSLLLDAV